MFSRIVMLLVVIVMVGAKASLAHFGMVIPSENMIMPNGNRQVKVNISFSHPFEGVGMELEKPRAFYAAKMSQHQDLTQTMIPKTIMGKGGWSAVFSPKRPGSYALVMEPELYWEPAEDCFIQHITKTYVAAFGGDQGWDCPLGLKTEIIPLTRPFGLWAGNLFQGRVILNSKPVPGAEVEVEYYNQGTKIKAPSEYMITQTIVADENGIFSYVAPFPGWWGFAALNTDDTQKIHKGKEKDIELGAVIWVRFEERK